LGCVIYFSFGDWGKPFSSYPLGMILAYSLPSSYILIPIIKVEWIGGAIVPNRRSSILSNKCSNLICKVLYLSWKKLLIRVTT
jgi:hypothetical protein